MFLQNFAQATGECTVNGQPVDCGEAAQAAGGIIAGFGIFMLIFFAFGIFSTVIWILSLIHLVQNEDVDNRILWIILVTVIPIANFVYYFGFKRSYDKQKAVGPQNQPASPDVPAATPGVVAPKDSGDNSFATGAVAGGAAASSGFSDQNPASSPDLPTADSSDQQPGSMDIGLQDDNPTPSSPELAQADSAPAYTSEDSSSDASPETTESVTPETDSYQSGSTDESTLPPDDSSTQPSSDDGAASADDDNTVQSDNNGGAGPSIG